VSFTCPVAVRVGANSCQNMEVSCASLRPLLTLTTPRSNRVEKVSAELVTLTYGTIVAQLCKDYDYNYADVNKQLDRMGYNIGIRLIEDFLAKSSAPACTNFRDVAEMISKVESLPHELTLMAYKL